MAIQFARIEIVSRSKGGNACCKGAYNARTIIKDQQTNVTYNFTKKGGNVYHTILLPDHVDKKFKYPKILMNEVERSEKRKNSQLLKDVVIALPDGKELSLEDRIAITHEIVDEMGWVKNGLGVQLDIHKPHEGEKNWHAHVLVTTRNLFTLVQREKNCNFIQAKEYLRDMVGITNNYQNKAAWLRDIDSDKFYKQAKAREQNEQYTEAAKVKRAESIYEQSVSIKYSMPNNVAIKYLSKHRGIETTVKNYQLSQDFRISKMWDNTNKQYYPALLAFARDSKGNITGGQSIYLNQETSTKADIAVNKRSFGKISGSFVGVQQATSTNSKNNTSVANVTIIAEGVETALSLQEAGIEGKILCSLGITNIKNYQPQANEYIIIAADNDGQNAPSVKTITIAKEKLEQQGAVVSIVMPPEKGDFNDVLKAQSKEAIRELIVPEIDRLTIGHKHNNIKSIGLEIVKSSDALSIDILQKFQNELKSLEKFATTESINTALQVYQQQNMEAFVNYSHKACSRAIEQKIINDLVTMQDKFNPNYDLGNVRFCDVVIYDFKGKSHTIPEDYLEQ